MQSRDPSEQAATGKTRTKAPVSTAAENAKSFIAGGFGGVCAVLVGTCTRRATPSPLTDVYDSRVRARTHARPPGHPFDLTKTRLQTASPGTYTGALDVLRRTLARDGPTGLYRGVVPPLLGVTPIFALSFWVPFPPFLSGSRSLTLPRHTTPLSN